MSAMNAPKWVQRIQYSKEIADRRKFWKSTLPLSRLTKLERPEGVLDMNVETFQLLEGGTFEDVRSRSEDIKSSLGHESVCVCPVGVVNDFSVDGNTSQSISREGFRVIWTDSAVGVSVFDKRLSQQERDFVMRLGLYPILCSDMAIGYCPLLHARLITTDDSSESVVIASVISRSGGSLSDFEKYRLPIQEAFDSDLVAFSNDGEFDSSMMVSIVISTKEQQFSGNGTSFITTGTIPVSRGIQSAKQIVKRKA